MLGEQEAILIRPPAGAGTTSAYAPTKTAFNGTSSAVVATGSNGLDIAGCWMTFLPTQDCHIRFGDSGVAAATISDMLFKAGVAVALWCSKNDATHYKVIRDVADGDLYAYRSG